ncbi:muscle M-line assembly protein unc-89 [Xenopus tropicalis]|uniref:Muscle M-line assembly protein unc-89 n=1 Tax=Xenopus tropicalis TaxID=8364 RepID=A0A8J1IP50_XENTR|nr:muscle M-line assembly protein unc-89 [Xenopus tropicalis]
MRTVTNIFIWSLALSDLRIAFFCIPFTMLQNISNWLGDTETKIYLQFVCDSAMRGHPVNSGIPGNYPALRRHIRRRKPPRLLLWSICGVTCFMFLGAAALLAVGYLNPFGSVGLAILGIGAVLFFGTILFLVMICLWVEKKYPGVQTLSFKIPSRRPPKPKTAYVNPNISGLSPSVPTRTDYTINTDLPPYTINVPRKVKFPSVPEEQIIIEETDKNINNPSSTSDSLLDETGNQGTTLENNVADSSPQLLDNSTVNEGKSHPFEEHTGTAKKQNKKTHHVEVPFEDYPPSASSKPASHRSKESLPNREEPKQLDGSDRPEYDSGSCRSKTSAPFLTEPEPGGSPKKHVLDSTNKASPQIQKLATCNETEKQVLPSKTNSPMVPNAACRQEQDSSCSGKSRSPQKDQRHTREPPTKQRKYLLVNQILNKPETFSGKEHVALPVDSKRASPKTQTDINSSSCSKLSSNSSSRKEESYQEDVRSKECKSHISMKDRVSVIKSQSPRNIEYHSLQTSAERAHRVSDLSSSTVPSHDKMLATTTEKAKEAIKHQGLPQSEKPDPSSTKTEDASHKKYEQDPQQNSSSQSKESVSLSASSPLAAKNHQTNKKQQTQHKIQPVTIPTPDYPSDSDSSSSRKLHQQEVQQTDCRQRSSQSKEASPAISRTSSNHKNNSEHRTIKKEGDS